MKLTREDIDKLLEKDENGYYKNLVIPKDYYGERIVLTGKTDNMLDLEEIFRLKKFVGGLLNQIWNDE